MQGRIREKSKERMNQCLRLKAFVFSKKTKAFNRKLRRNHLNDRSNVISLRQGAANGAALGTLVSVIAKKNNFTLTQQKIDAMAPSDGVPKMIKSPSLLDASHSKSEGDKEGGQASSNTGTGGADGDKEGFNAEDNDEDGN